MGSSKLIKQICKYALAGCDYEFQYIKKKLKKETFLE